MTENEARLILDVRISRFDHAGDVNEALEIAKQALEEIQQYRAIGTVEECREAVEKQTPRKSGCVSHATAGEQFVFEFLPSGIVECQTVKCLCCGKEFTDYVD